MCGEVERVLKEVQYMRQGKAITQRLRLRLHSNDKSGRGASGAWESGPNIKEGTDQWTVGWRIVQEVHGAGEDAEHR